MLRNNPTVCIKSKLPFFATTCFSLPTIDASLLSYVGVRKVGPVLVYVVVRSHLYSCQKVFEGHGYVCVQTVDRRRGVLVSWASECTNTNGPSSDLWIASLVLFVLSYSFHRDNFGAEIPISHVKQRCLRCAQTFYLHNDRICSLGSFITSCIMRHVLQCDADVKKEKMEKVCECTCLLPPLFLFLF